MFDDQNPGFRETPAFLVSLERQAGRGSTSAGQPQAAGRSTDTWSRRPAQAPAAGRPHQADHRHQAHPARPAAGQRWPVGPGHGYRPGECERSATRHSPPCHIPTPSRPQKPARRRLASLRHLHRRHPPPLDPAGQAMLEARQRSPERPPASAHAATRSPVAWAGRQPASPRPRLRPPTAHRSWQSVPLPPPTRHPGAMATPFTERIRCYGTRELGCTVGRPSSYRHIGKRPGLLRSCMPCHPHQITKPSVALSSTASVLLRKVPRRGALVRREAACGIAADNLLTGRGDLCRLQ